MKKQIAKGADMKAEIEKKGKDFSTRYPALVPVILKEVEKEYGKKVGKVRFSTIVYEGVSRPELDYEAFINAIPPIRHKVNIALTADTKANWAKGLFQLSHEVVHLLSALEYDEDQIVSNLEEGLAVHFSHVYTKREAGDEENFNAPTQRNGYRYAYDLVQQLLKIDPIAIRKLRVQQPHFNKITPKDFQEAGLVVDEELISGLLATFIEVRPEPTVKETGQASTKITEDDQREG